MTCIAVDDEPLALLQLEKYIERTEGLDCIATCYDAAEALAVLERHGNVDIIFLDINMPDMSGMDFVKSLPANHPMIIFTTAYSEYAIEGFKVEAVDYLTKPISYEEFAASVERARRRHPQPSAAEDNAIYVKDSGATHRILLDDIRIVKSMAEYVQIYTSASARPVTTLMSLRSLEERLPADKFMRVHRSYIINLTAIERFSHNRVTVAGTDIPVSESYRTRLRDYITPRTL